jgi:hypothetical protein
MDTSKVLRRRDTGFLIVMALIALLGSAIALYSQRPWHEQEVLTRADIEEMRTPLPAGPRKYQ